MVDDVSEVTDAEAGELSEAEQMALHAEPPRERVDGTLVGSDTHTRFRPLTTAQQAFAQGLIEGKTMRQAYRDAYPNAKGSDTSISQQANVLAKHPRVAKMLEDAWGQTVEALVMDGTATKRYVMAQLIAHSRTAKQEGTKLKALELLGKTVGLFIDKAETKQVVMSADQLKRELSGHLKLLDNVKVLKAK
jgi:hypothetical protein